MTAWWMTTTRVRKVRVRSSAALRVVAFGTARISADAAELEMDVMRAPAGWSFQMLPPGTRFSKGHATKCQGDSACWASTLYPPGCHRHRSFPSGPPGDDPGLSGFPRK